MAKTKTTFLADDGKEFATELEADAHNKYNAIEHRIEDFIDETKQPKATAGLLRRLLPQYLVFVEKNFPGRDAASVDTAAAAV